MQNVYPSFSDDSFILCSCILVLGCAVLCEKKNHHIKINDFQTNVWLNGVLRYVVIASLRFFWAVACLCINIGWFSHDTLRYASLFILINIICIYTTTTALLFTVLCAVCAVCAVCAACRIYGVIFAYLILVICKKGLVFSHETIFSVVCVRSLRTQMLCVAYACIWYNNEIVRDIAREGINNKKKTKFVDSLFEKRIIQGIRQQCFFFVLSVLLLFMVYTLILCHCRYTLHDIVCAIFGYKKIKIHANTALQIS